MLRSFLLWCLIINLGVLVVWALLVACLRGMIQSWSRLWFRVSPEQIELVNFAGIVFFEVLILVFNAVPYVALQLVK